MKDPYQILGVARTATAAEIKQAYRKLAKELHPDLNPGDSVVESRFKEVSAAYDLLSDADKRGQFDRGEINPDGSSRFAGGFRQGGRAGPDFDDIFSDLFGRRRGRARTAEMPGKNITYSVQVSFSDAILGTRRRITLYDGKSLQIAIPPGTADGQTLRLKGQGTPGMGGGIPGDALVQVQVEPHPLFRRIGDDIEIDLPVTLDEAVLGGRVDVPTVDGKVAMTVPAGANTGTRLRLKGKGAPRTGGGRGDQYVRLLVQLPDNPDNELSEFVRNWAKRHSYDVRRRPEFK
ncbi:MAG: DnaJ C-terminal domain-containing protein [Alphaproteobacteria bacterium]